ncbi:ras guanine nucleotide exchange factor F-like [Arapaima gigas]
MSRRTSPCLWTPVAPSGLVPCDRYKHACCAHGGSVYLLGGRETHPLSDFWRYDVARNEWAELDRRGDGSPDELEEHSMVAYQGGLYVFGGMIDSAYSQHKTPLWLYDTGEMLSEKCRKSHRLDPGNRKGHSAVVFQSSMYVYGGYVDMKGSSQDFWKFDFDTRQWSALIPAAGSSRPGPRHGHSAVVHLDSMYLFGGLMGLREQGDFWKWSFSHHSWCTIRFHSGPSRLVGHSVVLYRDSMLLFGGGAGQGSPHEDLWKFSFATRSWEKLAALPGTVPPCKAYHCSTGLGPSFQASSVTVAPQEGLQHSSSWPFGIRRSSAPVSQGDCLRGAMELDTFCVKGDADPEKRDGCDKRKSRETADTGEGEAQPLPDLLLVTGGKPLGGRAGISVWMMTLADL